MQFFKFAAFAPFAVVFFMPAEAPAAPAIACQLAEVYACTPSGCKKASAAAHNLPEAVELNVKEKNLFSGLFGGQGRIGGEQSGSMGERGLKRSHWLGCAHSALSAIGGRQTPQVASPPRDGALTPTGTVTIYAGPNCAVQSPPARGPAQASRRTCSWPSAWCWNRHMRITLR